MYSFFTAALFMLTLLQFNSEQPTPDESEPPKIAQVEPITEYIETTKSERFIRGRKVTVTHTANVEYTNHIGQRVKFQAYLPYEIVKKIREGSPVYIEYFPNKPSSERFQLPPIKQSSAAKWGVLSLFLLSAFALIRTIFRRGSTHGVS